LVECADGSPCLRYAGSEMNTWPRDIEIPASHHVEWDLGVRVVWCERRPDQWLVGWSDPERDDREDVAETVREGSPDDAARIRLTDPSTEHTVRLQVRPCPRPVVSRPVLPLTIPCHGRTVVFVGVPIWLRLTSGDTVLADVAATRLSDTWFGTPTEGVMGYATRTALRTSVEAIPRRPYRALSRLEIDNQADEPLVLERLLIPAPNLGLFEADGRLWTNDVFLSRELVEENASVRIRSGPPRGTVGARQVAAPLRQDQPSLLRAFNTLWGNDQ
jgi:hypothetical protein